MGSASVLLRNAVVLDGTGPAAVLITGPRVVWTGPDQHVPPLPPGAAVKDIGGRVLLPAFVDAHAHMTETGLSLEGVNLSGVRSAAAMLDLVAAAAAARPGQQITGHGWDELLLIDGPAPGISELDRASGGAEVYLTRVDVHSALVSSSLANRLGLHAMDGWSSTGRVERDAHHAARRATRFGIGAARRRQLQLRALGAAASAGIAEVHECSAPHVATEQDLRELLELIAAQPLPRIIPYWGELATSAEHAAEIRDRVLGSSGQILAGLAGDLMVDGSFGSHTAAVHHEYLDRPGDRGHLYLDAGAIGRHIAACTRAGLQAGFHAIGDRAVDAVLDGLQVAAHMLGSHGPELLRRARHRIEHLEGIHPEGFSTLSRFGVTASVQPMFDHEWGGTGRMYEHRLGLARTQTLNPFAGLHAAGVVLAFGSDSPVTRFAPWESVRAAALHHTQRHRLDALTALEAHLPASAQIHTGDVADLAAWDSGSLDEVLNDLVAGRPAPACVLTMRDGTVIMDATPDADNS